MERRPGGSLELTPHKNRCKVELKVKFFDRILTLKELECIHASRAKAASH